MSNKYIFTSESVTEGHPDKICDQISDAVLDNLLAQDSGSHVAVECFTTTGLVIIGGEVTSAGRVDAAGTAAGVFPEKIRPKSTVAAPIWRGTSPKILSRPNWPNGAKCKWRTSSAGPNRRASM